MKKINMPDVSEQIRGVSYKPEDVLDGSGENAIGILRANNISAGKINYDDLVYVRKEKISEKQMLKKGDILICASSGSKDLVGKAAQIKEDCGYSFGAFCKVVRPKNILPEFLGMYYQSGTYRAYISSVSEGANINNIKKENIDAISFPKYSDEEQRKITDILSKTETIIDSRRHELEQLDLLIKARFVEMFGNDNTNPNRLKKTTINDVCSSIVRGPFGSALKKEFFVEPDNTTYKVYEQKHAIQKSASIGTYYISEEKYLELKRFECKAGDILMSCSGTMGELYQLPEDCERGIINQALCKFTLNDKLLPVVFMESMRQNIGNLETKGSGIQNIAAVSYVKAMPINLPSMDVQLKFSDFVNQVDKCKLAVQKSLDETQLLFDSLMQQYFG